MPQARPIRRSPLLLALAIGFGPALMLSGCSESTKTETAAPENKPMISAKDSMDYYKKTQSKQNVPRR
jgi:uncharacterized protein YceK